MSPETETTRPIDNSEIDRNSVEDVRYLHDMILEYSIPDMIHVHATCYMLRPLTFTVSGQLMHAANASAVKAIAAP